jgi:hypothetical protein
MICPRFSQNMYEVHLALINISIILFLYSIFMFSDVQA